MQDSQTTVGAIVAEDFRAAAVFQRHGIDFCCGGHKQVAEACRESGINPAALQAELDAALGPSDPAVPRFNTWAPDLLAGYIVSNHHSYVRQAIGTLRAHTRKVADVHGERHPEVIAIADRFENVAQELTRHMMKEENMLFPYINALVAASRGASMPVAPFGEVANPIRMMEIEHQAAGDEMAGIRQLTGNYTTPADACTTFKVTYQELQAFEADLHQHVHLENNILFPKSLALERRLKGFAEASDRVQG